MSRLDKSTAEGAFDQAYDWPDVWVGHQTVDLAIPVGYWRSVGHSHHAFFMESFVDELAWRRWGAAWPCTSRSAAWWRRSPRCR
ncbi:hypothetical protein D3C72_2154430 [compost metagenome]